MADRKVAKMNVHAVTSLQHWKQLTNFHQKALTVGEMNSCKGERRWFRFTAYNMLRVFLAPGFQPF